MLASDRAIPPLDAMDLFSGAGSTDIHIGEGESFEHIGGHVLLDPRSGPLLANMLPPWIHVRAEQAEASIIRWLLDRLVDERHSGLPGAGSAPLAYLPVRFSPAAEAKET